jgi:UDP-N-acetylglucosamine 2-epimerase (non-hydrolysing)
MRENTERPITVKMGSNVMIGRDMDRLRIELASVIDGRRRSSCIPPLWDGHAAERIAAILV